MSTKQVKNQVHFGPMEMSSRALEMVTVLAPVRGSTAILPAGYPLRRATFWRKKMHLMVHAHGHPHVAVPNFFTNNGPITLATEDGVEVSRHMVMLMTSLSSRVEKALSALAVPSAEA